MDFEIYEKPDAAPDRRCVAIITRGQHLCSFTYGPDRETASRKARAAIEVFTGKKKAGPKFPSDIDTTAEAI